MDKLFALVCVLLFVSCTSEEIGNEIIFVGKESVKMSDLMKDCSFVKLETNDDNLIMDATIVKLWKDRIYILDSYSSNKGVYVFGMDGKYIGRIGNVGQGPGEYIMPINMFFDASNGSLFVKDVARNRILAYDLDSFMCISEYEVPFYSDCVEYLCEDRLIWYVGAGCANDEEFKQHIQVTDLKGTPITHCVERMDLPKRGLYNVTTHFHTCADKMFFHHPFSNVVYNYNVETNSVEYAYSLSWTDDKFPSLNYVKENKEQIIDKLKADNYITYYSLTENSQKLLCYFGKKGGNYIGVYDKKSQKGYYSKVSSIEDDLGLIKYVRPKSVYKDYFVSVVYMESLQGISKNSVLYPFYNEGMNQDGGNPIVVLYK